MKKHRKLKTVLLVVVGLFVLYNLVWLFLVWNRYHGFTEGMRELYSYQTYVIDEKDGYTYNVKIPDYLSFTGNLGIHAYEDADCALIIWPGIFKETTYGAFVPTPNGVSQGVMLTADGMPEEDAPEQIKQLVAENRESLDMLFEKAREQWDY